MREIEDTSRPDAEAAEHEDGAACRVEQRHVVNEGHARPHARADHGIHAVPDEAVMVQQGALGKAGRAGRVLDLHRVCRVRVAQLAVMFPCEQGVMVGQEDAVADGGDFAADRVGDLLHRVAAKIPDIIDRLGAGLFEHEFELALLVGRVHGDEGDARQAAGEFQQHPFRHIVGVDRDAGAFAMTARKGPGKALGVVQQVRIGPCPQHRAVIAEFLQG